MTLASEALCMEFKVTLGPFLWNSRSGECLHIKNKKLNQRAVFHSLK